MTLTKDVGAGLGRVENGVAAHTKVDLGITTATAEELGLHVEGASNKIPEHIQDRVDAWLENYKGYLVERTEEYLYRSAARQDTLHRVAPEAGEPVHMNYVYWDMMMIGPIQFSSLPPYRPSKIVGSDEFAMLFGVLFVNPAVDIFNPIPATNILGGRGFRVRFEQINLSDVSNGPDITFTGTFPAVAPVITFFPVVLPTNNPGPNPRLMEVNCTADITNANQPFAVFGTWHLDIDTQPSWLSIPGTSPNLEHDVPMRYLVYPK